MTFDNGQGQPMPASQGQSVPPPSQGAPRQAVPRQAAPGQIPLPPPVRKPTHNRRNGWLYVGLGAVFVLLGLLGFVGDTRAAVLNVLFIVLGVANVVMGGSAIRKSRTTLDPFSDQVRRTP